MIGLGRAILDSNNYKKRLRQRSQKLHLSVNNKHMKQANAMALVT